MANGEKTSRSSASNSKVWSQDERTSLQPQALSKSFLDHLHYTQGKVLKTATPLDRFFSLAYLVRDRLARRWIETQKTYYDNDIKRVYYLSAEFLLGRALTNNLMSLGIYDEMKEVVAEMGFNLEDILEQEPDAGLGNGGLGRLAACYMDSLATLQIPAYGYGIRYKFGIFDQVISNGFQVEKPEVWLKYGNPWEIVRPERRVKVEFYGKPDFYRDENGAQRVRWVDTKSVIGVPYDRPVAGFGTETVNTIRLWHARASEEFDLDLFNSGDYHRAVADKNESEVISKVLYPNDSTFEGKELRLKQQYFFVRCSLVDILRRHLTQYKTLENLPEKAAIQLNDTHPAIAVAELMRILLDIHRFSWEKAWDITNRTIAYTNHTVLSEALEKWPVELIGHVLPRHLQLIYEINRRFLREVNIRWPGDAGKMERMSLIEESGEKKVRMANMAIVGSHSVNGVAALHSDILKNQVFRDFYEMTPEKFLNVTNGVTPRRWLMMCNPQLDHLISKHIGANWPLHLDQLEKLVPLAEDASFRKQIREIKHANKVNLARYLAAQTGISIDPESLIDMQVKRIHEYKRQLLNVLHVAALYLKVKRDPGTLKVPRTFLIGGKAAPGYYTAKLIIKLIGCVSETIVNDRSVKGLALHFVPNYRVSLAEKLIPACELSEQISTAGMEASGTGNMKLALNGALTIGTLDGANVEIREAVGPENFFLFGMNAQEVAATHHNGYNARHFYETNPELREVIDLISSGFFYPEDPTLFRPLVDNLLGRDPYRVLGDYASYVECQRRVEEKYLDQDWWTKASIINIAKMGRFSSDRAIQEYADKIWNIKPIQVHLVGTDRPA